MKKKYLFKSLLYILAIGMSFVFLLPLIWMVRSSFMNLGQIFIIPPQWIPKPITLSNFKDAMAALPFGTYFKNTTIVVVLSVAGTILSSSLSAFGFTRISWKGRDSVFGLILTSMMLPTAVTLVPQFIGWKALGFYNTLVPIIAPAFFASAFNVFLLRQFYMSLPKELDESAYVDGAGYFTIYTHIILPLSRSALIVVGLFAFMFYWNDFFNPLIYLEDNNKFTIAVGLQQFISNYHAQWHLMMAAATVTVIPVLIVFLIGQKYFIEGITFTGLKG